MKPGESELTASIATCEICASSRQKKFSAEVNLHFNGLENLDRAGVLVFPQVVVCMDCGFSRFVVGNGDLRLLSSGTTTIDASSKSSRLDLLDFHSLIFS